jgi:NADH dehydrogenase FAD-containing subunit
MAKTTEVIILGGGLAGLAAASRREKNDNKQACLALVYRAWYRHKFVWRRGG